MRCPRCGLENPPVAAFCMRCGQQLQVESGKPLAQDKPPATPPGGAQRPAGQPGPQGQPSQPAPTKPLVPATQQPQVQPAPQPVRPPQPTKPLPEVQPAKPAGPVQPPVPASEEEEQEAWETMRMPVPEFPAPAPIPKPQQPAAPPPDASSSLTVPLGVVHPQVPPPPPPARPVDKIVCPNCYAVNAPGNNFCRECGNPLPKPTALAAKSVPPTGSLPMPPGAGPATTTLPPIPPPAVGKEVAPPGAPFPVPGPELAAAPEKAKEQRRIGPADALALLAVIAIVLALVPLFKWANVAGRNIWAFTYQGPTTGTAGPGFPGGPGVLPYAGWEWLTMGLIGTIAGALALSFLVARVGRGPMFTLAGCICLFPFAYHLTQSMVPLHLHGVEFTRGVGFKSLFFGISGSGYGGLGPGVWLLLGAGILLIVAGFLAPPRTLTRLLIFFLFFFLVLFLAAFSAVCYNFNLFIPQTIARGLGGG